VRSGGVSEEGYQRIPCRLTYVLTYVHVSCEFVWMQQRFCMYVVCIFIYKRYTTEGRGMTGSARTEGT